MILRANAHAKVNLHLEVLHQREDGYHEVETILQNIELHDRLSFQATPGPIHVHCEHSEVPTDKTNLCHKAAKLLRKMLDISKGVEIHLEKNIPVAAGLGGGSADAAACLLALPRLWRVEVDRDDLHSVARSLGADVPFFLKGGTQLARGIGDELTSIPSSGNGYYLVITPRQALSTAWVYAHLRIGLTQNPPKVNLQSYKALLSRFPERAWPGFNRLGDVVFPAFPSLHRLFLDLQDTDPEVALLSGSGPSLFAVYSTYDLAQDALRALDLRNAFTWVGKSISRGVSIFEGD